MAVKRAAFETKVNKGRRTQQSTRELVHECKVTTLLDGNKT